MSNKIVPTIYRAVIDDVIASIKQEFEEYGVAEDVLADLQEKWESKVMASHVAEFEVPPPPPPPQQQHVYQQHPHQMHMMQQHPMYPNHSPYAVPGQPYVKSEPADSRTGLNPMQPYAMPALPGPPPGPQLAGPRLPNPGGHQSVLSFPPGPPQPLRGPNTTAYGAPAPQQQQRIPQVDGPSSSSDSESPSPPPSQSYAPHTSHPSLPTPQASGSTTQPEDSEAINSDLDDSDTGDEEDADEGGAGESDIVFCTYDKVARVKNKWKCILKDGMIHINGKDYLFAKCTGEFEW
ncbi:transcription factor IIA, alpha/beta subunit [Athelia psychrophila]|uniref:Transcription initiation factor IIA large subunit n=1 Tax=Athelia psychrophila TaxID=1759441 RepID=A0A166X4V7_9AGAM|nr:transcription factor IIA, alpha/beta subunit [Fibularhizoctonia sp. CBS 109695]